MTINEVLDGANGRFRDTGPGGWLSNHHGPMAADDLIRLAPGGRGRGSRSARSWAGTEQRPGPNRVVPGGWLQSIADALKLTLNDDIKPFMADRPVCSSPGDLDRECVRRAVGGQVRWPGHDLR